MSLEFHLGLSSESLVMGDGLTVKRRSHLMTVNEIIESLSRVINPL